MLRWHCSRSDVKARLIETGVPYYENAAGIMVDAADLRPEPP